MHPRLFQRLFLLLLFASSFPTRVGAEGRLAEVVSGNRYPIETCTFDPYLEREVLEPMVCRSGIWASAELLFLTPHAQGLDFAITEDGSALTLGAGQVHSLNFQRNEGIRGEIGYLLPTGWGIALSHTNYSTSAGETVNRPPTISGQLFPTASIPGGPQEADVAVASGSFHYRLYDLDARHNLVDSPTMGIDLSGGLRWAQISEQLTTLLDGRNYSNGSISDDLNVDAFGVKFGSEGHWRIGSRFSMFARGGVGVYYGHLDKQRRETNLDGALVLVDLEDRYGQAITSTEAMVGLALNAGPLRISGGYELANWSSVHDRFRFVDDVEDGGLAPYSSDILLEGFFLRLATAW